MNSSSPSSTKSHKVSPRLIINADDFGLTKGINEEILRCHEEGIVTSASLMACGSAADEAMRAARSLGTKMGIGIHLTLDSEISIAEPSKISSIVTENGKFPSRAQTLLRLSTGRIRVEDVYFEWSMQIEKVIAGGLHPDHLDGHGHIHLFPALLPVVIDLAHHYDIPAIRLPEEPLRSSGGLRRLPSRIILNFITKLARRKLKNKLKHPDIMFGFSTGGCYKEEFFLKDLSYLREGDFAEAMFHPGPINIDVPSYKSWRYNWSVDSRTLRSKRVKDYIAKRGIKLVTFKELIVN